MVIFLGMLISLKFNLAINYLEKMQAFSYKKWDIDTCTPADYTIQLDISEKQYENYKDSLANGEYAKSLDEIIIDTLETEVAKLDSKLGSSHMAAAADGIEVASITFGYKNGELIRALRDRGALIGAGAFHKVPEKDDLLNTIIEQDIDKLQQPVCAFVTFTQQEAYERCEGHYLKYLRTDGSVNTEYEPLMLLGEPTTVTAAPEPSNVIWENLEVTPVQRGCRKTGVTLLITLFIFLTFLLYSALKSRAGENKLKYPTKVDCEGIV